MTSFVSHTSVDCRDAHALSVFWCEVLGYEEDPGDPNLPGDEECPIQDPETGHTILFLEVPDPTPGKNRLHFDLRPRSGSRDAEVARVIGIGAVMLDDLRREDGTGWAVLADPEGNEFCVLRSYEELRAAS